MRLETHLRGRRHAGRKVLMPFVTAGITPQWTEYVLAFADAGADAVEVGLPFSDPTLDGAVIQEANAVALGRGATLPDLIAELPALAAACADRDVVLVVSTYANTVVGWEGPQRFCAALAAAGIAGLIVPDLPLDEAQDVATAAAAAGIDLVLLVAPTTPQPRVAEIAERAGGFLYTVSTMGTTGEREVLADAAIALVERIRSVTGHMVLVGFGIATPEHASKAARSADGIVVGASIMRRVLGGADPERIGAYVGTLRQALDEATHA
jgi:tryptophan synthase alpha chain